MLLGELVDAVNKLRPNTDQPSISSALSAMVKRREIAREGRGVIVLIRDTKNTSITDVLTRDPEERMTTMLKEYGVGAQILVDLGVKDMTILTRSPVKKLIGLDGYGLNLVGQRTIPTEGAA